MDAQGLFNILSKKCKESGHNWFTCERHKYPPLVFNLMTAEERELLLSWYNETSVKWPNGDGASGYTAISTISGFLLGSGIKSIVQCGHFVGFSTLLFGFIFRYMGFKHAIYSIDICTEATEYTKKWIAAAGLADYVKIVLRDSSDHQNVQEANAYFEGKIESIYIDSAHTYSHTKKELATWYDFLAPSGFLFLHDSSDVAMGYDAEGKGGVKLALLEMLHDKRVNGLLVNSKWYGVESIYSDPCGLAIIQK